MVFTKPFTVPDPAVLVMLPELAELVALIRIPEMVKVSVLLVPEQEYVIVICVVDMAIDCIEISEPFCVVPVGVTLVSNSKFAGLSSIIV